MSNKGRYFTREIDLDSIVRNPLRSNLNANNFTITNVGPPISQNSVARISDISGGGGANVWYVYPALTDISLNCNGIQDVSSITFCGRQTYLRQTLATFDISSNRSIRFNNNQLFLQNNGNIGIGTNTPIYSLDVSGSARMRYIIDINTSDGSNNSILIGTSNGIRWSKDLSLNNLDVSNKTTINDLSATKIWSRDLSAVNLQASGTGIINDLSATKIWSRDLSAVNLQVSTTGIINDLSATKIWSRDLSAVNLQVSTSAIINDLSATKIWTRDLSAANLQVSGAGIINDLSATKIWSRDLSAVNLQVSTSAIINDLSATKIWTRDLSAVNANITNIIANNIDASFNIIDASDNKNYYITFSESSGYQKIKIDTNKLIYNPGLDRLGINIEPIYNLDVSGSLRPTTIIDRNNSAGTLGQVLTSTVSGIVWSSSSSSNQWTTSGSNIYNTNYLTGNVAIGKTIPSYSLDVSGSFKSSRIIDVSNSSGLSGETMISLGNGNGYKWITPVYGSFSSDISQNIDISGGLGYPTAITYNRAEISNLCDFSGSRIYVRRSGIFKFSYSIQMVQTANQSHKVYIYIKQNGVILDRTSSTIMLLKDSEIFPMCEYILPLNKGDYIEVIFYSLGTTVTAVYLLDSTHIPPYFPSAPSIISNIYSLVTYP
jgi:hypothetical protein